MPDVIMLVIAIVAGAFIGNLLYDLTKAAIIGFHNALTKSNKNNAEAYMKQRKEAQNRAIQEYIEKNAGAFDRINQRIREERKERQHKSAHNDCIVERRRRSHDRSRDNSSINSGTGSGLM